MTTTELTGLQVNPGKAADNTHVVVLSLIRADGNVSGQLVLSEDNAAAFAKGLLDVLAMVRRLNKGHADA